MLHIVRLIERQFPRQAGPVIAGLVVLSAVGLIAGVVLAHF